MYQLARFQALFSKSHSALECGKVCCPEKSVNDYQHLLCNNSEEPRPNILTYLSLIVSVPVAPVPAHLRNLRTQARKFLGFVFLRFVKTKIFRAFTLLQNVKMCLRIQKKLFKARRSPRAARNASESFLRSELSLGAVPSDVNRDMTVAFESNGIEF